MVILLCAVLRGQAMDMVLMCSRNHLHRMTVVEKIILTLSPRRIEGREYRRHMPTSVHKASGPHNPFVSLKRPRWGNEVPSVDLDKNNLALQKTEVRATRESRHLGVAASLATRLMIHLATIIVI